MDFIFATNYISTLVFHTLIKSVLVLKVKCEGI